MTNRNELIDKLINDAQVNIWTNELAMKFTEEDANAPEKDKKLKIEACKHHIERDTAYISFLEKNR